MTYAAARQLVPPPGEGGAVSLPWETDDALSPARQETWLLSFIDILALLLTLFVLLLAYQDQGAVEPAAVSGGDDDAPFSIDLSLDALALTGPLSPHARPGASGYAMPGEGLLPGETAGDTVVSATENSAPSGAEAPPALPDDHGAETAAEAPAIPVDTDMAVAPPAVDERPEAGTPQAAARTAPVSPPAPTAADRLLETLEQTLLADRVEMTVEQGIVNLNISDSILFAPASAALSEDGLTLLNELAVVLQDLSYRLSVEGHTDNIPIRTARYPSNWELSSARAARVTRQLISQGIPADRIRAIGYGDTRPRGDNASAEGRARNRRVTFVLTLEPEAEATPEAD